MRKTPTREARLQALFDRLTDKAPFRSFEEAYGELVATLNQVEDELTAIPNRPENWQDDGRMYPPQRDNWFEVPGRPDLTRMRTKAHQIFIGANGAMEIRAARTGVVVFSVAGADGRKVGNP